MQRFIPIFSLIAVLSAAGTPAQADEPWQFQIAPYVWIAGLDGDVGVLPGVPPSSVDASFSDIVDNLDFGFMLAGEARKGRAGFLADILYTDISQVIFKSNPIVMMKMTGEVCSDDDKIGHVGFQRRPNHQIETVGWPQSKIPSISDGI